MSPFKETKFYDIGSENTNTINQVVSGGAVFFLSIGNDPQTIQFERTVYSMLDLFGYLGGLYDFMLVVGFLFVSGFQDKIYQNLIASNMYQVRSTAKTDKVSLDLNQTCIEETKNNWQSNTTTLNTSSSSMRKSNRNCMLSSINYRHDDISTVDNIDNFQTYKKLVDFRAECNTRRMYTFKFHNICCPVFK